MLNYYIVRVASREYNKDYIRSVGWRKIPTHFSTMFTVYHYKYGKLSFNMHNGILLKIKELL